MALSTLALVGGLIWLPLGQWLALGAWLPLTWLAEGARILAMPRWAAVDVPVFPLWMLLASYGVIGVWWWLGLRGTFGDGTIADTREPAQMTP
jgi:competence protein ComEC